MHRITINRTVLVAAFAVAGQLPLPAGISATALRDRLAQPGAKPILVDLRLPAIYQEGTIPGAINIPAAVLLEKQLSLRGEVILFDAGTGGESPEALADSLRRRGVAGADWLGGGYAAWCELADCHTTARKGARRYQRNTLTYEQLLASDQPVCIVDLRPAGRRGTPPGKRCPIAGLCSDHSFDYCPDLASFHAAGRGRHRDAGDGPLIVLIDDDNASAAEVQRQLRAQGRGRSVILLGGAETVLRKGLRGLSRSGGVIGEADSSTLPESPGQSGKPQPPAGKPTTE